MNFRLRLLLWYMNNWAKPVDYSNISAIELRQQNRKELNKLGWIIDGPPAPMARVQNLPIITRDGAKITVRYYEPLQREGQGAILFYHGGGFVTRDLDSHDKVCRRLAEYNQLPVFSVDYRLAPEYKFPIPGNDCEDAFHWLVRQAKKYNIDNQQIVLIGDSAGGNMATVVSQRSRGVATPKPWRQVLIYPTVDARLQYPSVDSLGKGYFLTKPLMQWFVDQYKRTDTDAINPDMSPLLAEDLSAQPPTYLCTAELDPLIDEGLAYAEKLKAAGVSVKYKEFKGVIHGFINMPRIMPQAAQDLYLDIRNFIRQ